MLAFEFCIPGLATHCKNATKGKNEPLKLSASRAAIELRARVSKMLQVFVRNETIDVSFLIQLKEASRHARQQFGSGNPSSSQQSRRR